MTGLARLEERGRELERRFAEPGLSSNDYQKLSEEYGRLMKLVADLRAGKAPADERDGRDVLLEIRAGVGGEEAGLFAGDLLRMYCRYAERHGWRVKMLSSTGTELGGYKDVCLEVSGRGAYSGLRREAGTHRVQRVPKTESGGRVHTSAATVSVLSEATSEEVSIKPEDVRIDTFRAGGAGGQYVNRTESAVRVTHLATGLVAQCQNEKSQLQNKEQALKVLAARLGEHYRQQQAATESAERRAQVGKGDRSEKIRTYNWPQGRVTDHRSGVTSHDLKGVLDGNLEQLLGSN